MHGFGLGQMMLRLEQEVFELHPDHVLLVLTLPADLGRTNNVEFVHAKPAFTLRDGRLAIENHPVPLASNRPWLERHSYTAAWLFGRPRPLEISDSWDDVWQVTRLLVERMRRECDERGVGLTVVGIAGPSWLEAFETHPQVPRQIGGSLRALAGTGVELVDPIGYLTALVRNESGLATSTRAHWSGRGNCLLAEWLARELTGRHPGWQLATPPPDCRAGG